MKWVVVHFPDNRKKKPSPSKFNNHLASKDDFIPIVQKVWNQNIMGCTMYSVVSKMKRLKKEFRNLNAKCGNVHDKVKKLREGVAQVQKDMVGDPENGDVREDHAHLLKAFKEALLDEERFLRQKSKVHWLKEGDGNTAYFHRVIKGIVNRSRIETVENPRYEK